MRFISKNKIAVLLLLFFAFLNLLVFITPIEMSLMTSQLNLFGYFLILYFLASLAPILIILNLIKNKLIIATVVILLIIMVFSWESRNYFFPPRPIPFLGEKVNEEVYLDFSTKNVEVLKSKQFCFKVFIPTYLPTTPYQMKVENVYASTKSCEHQVVQITYAPSMILIQVPKNYNFDFRVGFENLKGLRNRVLAGSKVSINGSEVYLASVDNIDDGFEGSPYRYPGKKLLYWERDGTIFFFLTFNSRGLYPEKTYMRVAESMKPIN